MAALQAGRPFASLHRAPLRVRASLPTGPPGGPMGRFVVGNPLAGTHIKVLMFCYITVTHKPRRSGRDHRRCAATAPKVALRRRRQARPRGAAAHRHSRREEGSQPPGQAPARGVCPAEGAPSRRPSPLRIAAPSRQRCTRRRHATHSFCRAASLDARRRKNTA